MVPRRKEIGECDSRRRLVRDVHRRFEPAGDLVADKVENVVRFDRNLVAVLKTPCASILRIDFEEVGRPASVDRTRIVGASLWGSGELIQL